jgi:predicted glutamine amidotransferase
LCGLVGVFGQIHQKELNALHWLLHFDVIRGHHSTGVAAIHKQMEVGVPVYKSYIYKELGFPENLYKAYPQDWKDYIYQRNNPICIMGHNRWATQGGISKETAHPFEFDNVIGAHNGTVSQWSMSSLHGHKKYNIDSKIIYHHLSETKGDIQSVWDVADGAMALTWWDKVEFNLKVARNNQRSLFYTKVKNKETIFWASEAWMLQVALDKSKIDFDKIHPFQIDTLYTFNLDGYKVVKTKKPLSPFKRPVYQGSPHIFSKGTSQQNQFKGGNVINYPSNTNPPKDNNSKVPETSWLKVTEYNQQGKEKHEGVFFGKLEDGSEIRISTGGNYQKDHHSKLMKACEDKRPYFRFKTTEQYYMYNMINVHSSVLEHMKNVINSGWEWDKPKDIPQKEEPFVFGFLQHKLTEKQFFLDYEGVCCCCNNAVAWEQASTCAYISENMLVCKTCQDDPWVQDVILSNSH